MIQEVPLFIVSFYVENSVTLGKVVIMKIIQEGLKVTLGAIATAVSFTGKTRRQRD